uniref:Uncharacterized protein n=1 Tax=Cacopsylla melanoneura TaxID=428564 RepID=A0A8D8R5N1_9HEMI
MIIRKKRIDELNRLGKRFLKSNQPFLKNPQKTIFWLFWTKFAHFRVPGKNTFHLIYHSTRLDKSFYGNRQTDRQTVRQTDRQSEPRKIDSYKKKLSNRKEKKGYDHIETTLKFFLLFPGK